MVKMLNPPTLSHVISMAQSQEAYLSTLQQQGTYVANGLNPPRGVNFSPMKSSNGNNNNTANRYSMPQHLNNHATMPTTRGFTSVKKITPDEMQARRDKKLYYYY